MPTPDQLVAALRIAIDALDVCADYLDDRADADCDQDGFVPNKEMQILSKVERAIDECCSVMPAGTVWE